MIHLLKISGNGYVPMKSNDEFEFKDGLFYFKGLLYIPLGPTRLKIIQMRHDLPTVGHFGFNKTMELI
jgi:hypothetical protein